jgi:hypothetical protein
MPVITHQQSRVNLVSHLQKVLAFEPGKQGPDQQESDHGHAHEVQKVEVVVQEDEIHDFLHKQGGGEPEQAVQHSSCKGLQHDPAERTGEAEQAIHGPELFICLIKPGTRGHDHQYPCPLSLEFLKMNFPKVTQSGVHVLYGTFPDPDQDHKVEKVTVCPEVCNRRQGRRTQGPRPAPDSLCRESHFFSRFNKSHYIGSHCSRRSELPDSRNRYPVSKSRSNAAETGGPAVAPVQLPDSPDPDHNIRFRVWPVT